MKKIFSIVLVPTLIAATLIVCVAWARSVDPYTRKEFTVPNADCRCLVVLPKRLQGSKLPVVLCIRQKNEEVAPELRQFADVGVAAVGCEFNAKSRADCDRRLSIVANFLAKQDWVDGHSIAWMEYSRSPWHVVMRICRPILRNTTDGLPSSSAALIVQCDRDVNGVAAKEWSALTRECSDVKVAHIECGDEMAVNGPAAIRCIAEYCKSKLTPQHPLPEPPCPQPMSGFVCFIIPAAAAGLRLWKRHGNRSNAVAAELFRNAETFWIGIRARSVVAIPVATCAVAAFVFIGVHLALPMVPINPRTVAICRHVLVPRSAADDFASVSALSVWRGHRMATLLDDVDIANYTVTRLINWKLERSVYREYVLSPVIDHEMRPELNWRKELWKNIWPRVRHETSPQAATEVVARCLRERVAIVPDFRKQSGVESVWKTKIANGADFELLYVAALRSVGIPARLTNDHRAQFWNNKTWCAAPRPLTLTWMVPDMPTQLAARVEGPNVR